jgi:hypothetical protein
MSRPRSGSFRNLLQLLRVMFNERPGRFHSFARKHVLSLQRIYGRLAFEMIVADNESFLGLLADVRDPFFPALEFFRLVQIVVTVIAVVGLKPLFVVASMQAHVTDWRCHVRGPAQ